MQPDTSISPACAPSLPDDQDRRLLALLRAMYPLWRITCRIDRHSQVWWWARRYWPLTPSQHRAGLLSWFARRTLTQTAAELSHQYALAQHHVRQGHVVSRHGLPLHDHVARFDGSPASLSYQSSAPCRR